MDKATTKKRSCRFTDKPNDKKSIDSPICDLNNETTNETANQSNQESNDGDENKVEKMKERLGDFLAKVQDSKLMENCIMKIDKHVTNLLDVVKLKEKKRKNTKNESNGLDKIDLTSSDSILTQINLKNVFNTTTFNSLPLYYQYKLIKLLPKCDQEVTSEGWFNLNSSALSNEYFTKANRFWLKQLKESKLNSDFIQKCKSDLDKERQKLDPFKIKNFEPIWNEPLESKKYFNDLLDKKRQDKMKRKKEQLKAEKNKILNAKMNRSVKRSPNQNDKNSPNSTQKNKAKAVRPAKPRTTKQTKTQTKKATLKKSINEPNSQVNTSPLPVGSITIRKSLDSQSPIQSSSNQQSPTNSKSFLISNNGKLFQIQQNIFVAPFDGLNGRNQQSTSYKRNIDLNLDDSKECECEQKPLSNCAVCQAFCHLSCLDSFNVCDNCVKK